MSTDTKEKPNFLTNNAAIGLTEGGGGNIRADKEAYQVSRLEGSADFF